MSETLPQPAPVTADTFERYAHFLKRTREMGVVGHRGGLQATRDLIEMCELQPGQRILEVGCGSGYTACTVAKEHGVFVAAADLEPHLIARSRQRARSSKVESSVELALADARRLPFADAAFDGVICESILAFLEDKATPLAEFHRVLKPGGFVALNEITFLETPPADLLSALRGAAQRVPGFLAVPVDPAEHRRLLEDGGFTSIRVETGDVPTRQQIMEQLQVDGFRALKPFFASIFDREMRQAVYRREMGEAQRVFEAHTGYGLYFGRKPPVA
ncbi:MAG: methyltransferase domain-containing protein [Dehalococcoidia bacterium]